jgi:hypothetical protein
MEASFMSAHDCSKDNLPAKISIFGCEEADLIEEEENEL